MLERRQEGRPTKTWFDEIEEFEKMGQRRGNWRKENNKECICKERLKKPNEKWEVDKKRLFSETSQLYEMLEQ